MPAQKWAGFKNLAISKITMKEINKPDKDTLKVVEERQVQKKLKFLGELRPKPGHKCFQLNVKTGKITEAVFESATVEFGKYKNTIRKKLIQQPDCIYVCALNRKSSIKHFGLLLALNYPVNKK